jgi:hypothetical protein
MTPAAHKAVVNIAHVDKDINASLANEDAAGFKLGQLPSNTDSTPIEAALLRQLADVAGLHLENRNLLRL